MRDAKNRTGLSGRLAAFITLLISLCRESLLIGSLLDAETAIRKRRGSLLFSLFDSPARKALFLKLKLRFGAAVENSILIGFFSSLADRVLYCTLRTAALFCLSFGGFIVAAHILSYTQFILALRFTDTFLFGIMLVLLSFCLFPFSRRTAAELLNGSRLLGHIIMPDLSFVRQPEGRRHTQAPELAFLFGIFCGALSVAVSPKPVLLGLFIVFCLVIIPRKPENGILLTIILSPFSPIGVYGAVAAISCFSAFCKVLRGKRAPYSKAPGIALFVLLVTVLPTLFVTYDQNVSSEGRMILLFLFWAMSFLTLMNSSALLKKAVHTVAAAGVLSEIYLLICLIRTILMNRLPILSVALDAGLLTQNGMPDIGIFAVMTVLTLPVILLNIRTFSPLLGTAYTLLAAVLMIYFGRADALLALLIAAGLIIAVYYRRMIVVFAFALSLGYAGYTVFPAQARSILNAITAYLPRQNPIPTGTSLGSLPNRVLAAGCGIGDSALSDALFSAGHVNESVSSSAGTYVSVIAAFGIPVTILLIVCFCILLRRLIEAAKKSDSAVLPPDIRTTAQTLLFSLTACFIYAVRQNLFETPAMLLPFVSLLLVGARLKGNAMDDYVSSDTPREELPYS